MAALLHQLLLLMIKKEVVSSSLTKIKIWNYKTVKVIHNLKGHKKVLFL